MNLSDLKVEIWADGGDLESLRVLSRDSLVKGVTTNPSLMRAAGVTDYEEFARALLEAVPYNPVCFEVFSDDFAEARRQALKFHSRGLNVYVKVPITNRRRESSWDLVRSLSQEGVRVNVTAVTAIEQVVRIKSALLPEVPSIISVFAGRIADTGRDPTTMMKMLSEMLRGESRLLWASVREVYNIWQAEDCGCDMVTVPEAILLRAHQRWGADLEDLSLETVRMLTGAAEEAGYEL